MALWERVMAAIDAFKNFNAEPELILDSRYGIRWSLYNGTMFDHAWRKRPPRDQDPRLYLNTRLLWKIVESIVDFYATTVYQGSLSTDGTPLPGGIPEAIPLEPQAAKAADDPLNQRLRLAIAERWNATNAIMHLRTRPMYGASLGDVLTEFVDDIPGRKITPQAIWPGWVPEIEVDALGNVKWVAIEYPVHIKPRSKSDKTTKEEHYLFRKELSGEDFRFFKNGDPWDYENNRKDGPNSVIPNPYKAPGDSRGFVPAIWDRHKAVPGVRGHCAFEGTIQALLEVNSFLSHGFDYQRKHFSTPVVVQGQLPSGDAILQFGSYRLSREDEFGQTGIPDELVEEMAESRDILVVGGEQVGIHTIPTDLGQALQVLDWVKAGIDRENPEGSFYEKLGNMTSLDSAPAVERALGNAVSLCRWARAGYDMNTVKQLQMEIAMAGFRINNRDWGDPSKLTRRQQAWKEYDMTSYGKGELDFTIADRPIIPPTAKEITELVLQKEKVMTEWGMKEIGLPDDVVQQAVQEREEEKKRQQEMEDEMLATAKVAAKPKPPTGGSR